MSEKEKTPTHRPAPLYGATVRESEMDRYCPSVRYRTDIRVIHDDEANKELEKIQSDRRFTAACAAMQAIITSPAHSVFHNEVAQMSVDFADSLLRALSIPTNKNGDDYGGTGKK